LVATCGRNQEHCEGIPDPDCSCGIYAASDLDVINSYLTDDQDVAPVAWARLLLPEAGMSPSWRDPP
jgi:hypothetical protein